MTKHLINYCPIDWYEDELKRKGMTLAGLVQQLGVDGIEQFVYRDPETLQGTDYWRTFELLAVLDGFLAEKG